MDVSWGFPWWFDVALVFLALLGVALIGFVGQALTLTNKVAGEYSRKLIHIWLALWIGCWRFFLPVGIVIITSLILALGVFISKQMGILTSIHGVRRSTHGEIVYALGITATAILFPEPTIFALAIINLGFADGLAAVVGIRYGRRRLALWGDPEKYGKTLVGSLTAFSFAAISGLAFWILIPPGPIVWLLALSHIILAAFLISALEFVSRQGFDNLIIPLATGFFYSQILI